MTSITDQFGARVDVPRRAATGGVALRDPRIDFYRGIAMLVIFIAHVPGNSWAAWMPSRFGLSDSAEIFVFCSGLASAIAYGRVYDRAGWFLGTIRVGARCWQIYWAHIALFLVCAGFLAALDMTGAFDQRYIGSLNLWRFFSDDTGPLLVRLMTLSYVPNYFDILPMYLVLLALVPVMMGLARVHVGLAIGASLLMWLLAQSSFWSWGGLNLPAEPWSDRQWFFNPFAWQLLFFTGFAIARGWVPSPPVRPWLMGLAVAILVVFLLISGIGIRILGQDWALDWRSANGAFITKTDLGAMRFLHFAALAYVAASIAGPGGRALEAPGPRHRVVGTIRRVGQQSLAVFLFSMFWARVTGVILDMSGRGPAVVALANLAGLLLIVAVAYFVAWMKREPWRPAKT